MLLCIQITSLLDLTNLKLSLCCVEKLTQHVPIPTNREFQKVAVLQYKLAHHHRSSHNGDYRNCFKVTEHYILWCFVRYRYIYLNTNQTPKAFWKCRKTRFIGIPAVYKFSFSKKTFFFVT